MSPSTADFQIFLLLLVIVILSCTKKKDQQFEREIRDIKLKQGDIALCGQQQFGTVDFSISCKESVKSNFNLAAALLHSFEYEDAEKVFAKVIEEDPECVMAYWGVAMSNFHALWAMNEQLDLEKGARTIALARSLDNKTERESDYIEAIGAYYDNWKSLDHKARSRKFEQAMERIYKKYPEEKEAAIFYALALDATADPTDKTYRNQKKAGEILNNIYPNYPNHPGIAHYIIHTYDYPELAVLGLPAAKAYASIAPASAHAQHMPSHIFTRLGLWNDAINSNLESIKAAQCYAGNAGIKGHWDEELHGMDYLTYAYLQKGQDQKAKELVDLLKTYTTVSPINGKAAYAFASIPARYVIERKQWQEAADLENHPNFPWEKFPWENSLTHFAKLLGHVHTKKIDQASKELDILKSLEKNLTEAKENYKANQVKIQITAGQGWIQMAKGRRKEAIDLMNLAAEMEEATAKHPVTPGEIVPAGELLGDMLMYVDEVAKALGAYELNLKSHPNRLNGLLGAASAAQKLKNPKKTSLYVNQLLKTTLIEDRKRPELIAVFNYSEKKVE